MRIGRASRASLLLMELMVSLLLFALAGAACVRVLYRAGELSRDAQRLTRAVEETSSAAELIRSAQTRQEALELLKRAWPQTQSGEETVIPMEDGTLGIRFRQDQRLTVCYIVWYAEEEPVYTLEIVRSFREDGT